VQNNRYNAHEAPWGEVGDCKSTLFVEEPQDAVLVVEESQDAVLRADAITFV
jgi:hypothetical protein